MPVPPSVLDALRVAVERDPTDVPLRLHLAGALVESGSVEEGLHHATAVLESRPDEVAALDIAAACSAQLGDHERAAAYRRLLSALGGVTDRSAAPPPSRTSMPAADPSPVPETADEILAGWAGTEPVAVDPVSEPETVPKVRLADVAGMTAVKRRLEMSFLGPARNPELAARFGKAPGGGLLLWGPPGCGKTYVARALAGELGASFHAVGLDQVLDMWIGSSERNLHGAFVGARLKAPTLLFFDEIDALGHARTRTGGSALRGVVNQLLVELDGTDHRNDGVFVLAATNHPWDVDTALLRPGRLDRTVFVGPPDVDAREAVLTVHLRDRPAEQLDLRRIAERTAGWSGADLALVCNHAAEAALETSVARGCVVPVSQKDLERAVKAGRTSIDGWLRTAENHVKFGNDSGMYDDLADYLRSPRH